MRVDGKAFGWGLRLVLCLLSRGLLAATAYLQVWIPEWLDVNASPELYEDTGLLGYLEAIHQQPLRLEYYIQLAARLLRRALIVDRPDMLQLAVRAAELGLPFHRLDSAMAFGSTHRARWRNSVLRASRKVYRAAHGFLEAHIFPPSRPWDSEALPALAGAEGRGEVQVMISVFGTYGAYAGPTLRSLLLHRSCHVRFHVVGDLRGWRSLRLAVAQLPSKLLQGVSWEFVPLWGQEAYLSRLAELPSLCLNTYMGHSAFMRGVFAHEVLTKVRRIIYIDIGDVLVFGDVAELWQHFDAFNGVQLIGIALESGVNMASPMKKKPSDSWTNTGVLLLDLEKQREAEFSQRVLRLAWQVEGACNQADMSLLGLLFHSDRPLFLELSSLWHYMPSSFWQVAEHTATWVNQTWPPELIQLQTFPGLHGPGQMEHPCPQWYEIAGGLLRHISTRTGWQQSYLLSAKRLQGEPTMMGMSCAYSRDCTCGAKVKLVHFVSHHKWKPWARRLLAYWADGDPPVDTGRGFYAQSLLAAELMEVRSGLQEAVCRRQLAQSLDAMGQTPPSREAAASSCERHGQLRAAAEGPAGTRACSVGERVSANFRVAGESLGMEGAIIADVRADLGQVWLDWDDLGIRGRQAAIEDVFPLGSDIPCAAVLAHGLVVATVPGEVDFEVALCVPRSCLPPPPEHADFVQRRKGGTGEAWLRRFAWGRLLDPGLQPFGEPLPPQAPAALELRQVVAAS